MFIFPLIATLVGFIFSLLVMRQYFNRRRPYQLVWGIGLLMFALGSTAETVAALTFWTDSLAKTYYFFGAMVTVGFLSMGTIYLHTSPRIAKVALTIILIISISAALMLVRADVNTVKMQGQEWEWKEVMPTSARIIPIIINSLGSLILIGGAIYSAYVTWRRKEHYERMWGSILIASGVLVIGAMHTIGGFFGLGRQQLLSIAMAIGVTLMFLGFLETGRSPKR